MQEQIKKQLEQLKGTANGEAIKEYIDEEIAKMQDIYSIKTEVELIAKQEAGKILKELFRFLEVKQNTNNRPKYN